MSEYSSEDEPVDEHTHQPGNTWADEGSNDRDPSYVGITTGGVPVFHSEGMLLFDPDGEGPSQHAPGAGEPRELEAEETLGEAIADVGEALGWESLSEFGRRHADDER